MEQKLCTNEPGQTYQILEEQQLKKSTKSLSSSSLPDSSLFAVLPPNTGHYLHDHSQQRKSLPKFSMSVENFGSGFFADPVIGKKEKNKSDEKPLVMNECSSNHPSVHNDKLSSSTTNNRPAAHIFKRLSSYEGAILSTHMELEQAAHKSAKKRLNGTLSLDTSVAPPPPPVPLSSSQQGKLGHAPVANNLSFSDRHRHNDQVALRSSVGISNGEQQSTSPITTSDSDCSPGPPESRRLTVDSGICLCGSSDVYGTEQKAKHSGNKLSHVMKAS